jgi:hypothetical protein
VSEECFECVRYKTCALGIALAGGGNPSPAACEDFEPKMVACVPLGFSRGRGKSQEYSIDEEDGDGIVSID